MDHQPDSLDRALLLVKNSISNQQVLKGDKPKVR